jgi:helicase
MKIEELQNFGIQQEFIDKFKQENISELYPPQVDILKRNLLKEKNLVVAMPTAAGKTFVATLAMIDKLSEKRGKIVYIVPLVALANEKYEYYKNFFHGKCKVAISVGDLDSADPWLNDYDIIICTTEKLDSLIRHGVNWINEISLIVVDEIHLINDPSRGPTLEILLTLLRELSPRSQVFALSATIRNAKEIADWMNANLLLSDFRPVKLYEGVGFNSKISFYGRNEIELSNLETDAAIVDNTLKMKKQCLLFVSTRKNAEKAAENLQKIVKSNLGRNEAFQLEAVASEIENVLEIPTRQCKKLASFAKNGVVFHHAGLLGKQRRIIEENFKKGLIKAIAATPTLALGVNLPAFRVIIKDAKRFYSGIGSVYIPVLEYKQMTGRAGRPQYDDYGESVLIARSEEEARDLTERFILGDTENITSKLAVEPILRMHTLALIANDFKKSEDALLNFFVNTFYGFQYGDIYLIEEKILDILDKLSEWGFISKRGARISATKLGKRVCELYIDPLTAHNFIVALDSKQRKIDAFSFLQLISNTLEMKPLLTVRSIEFVDINEFLVKKEKNILQQIPEEYDLEFDNFLKSIKTAMMFGDWLNEKTEDEILAKYKVAPGELRNRLGNADWLIYSLHEIAQLIGKKDLLKEINKTRITLSYGIKEELISLVKLKQIGRVRARKLWNANIRSLDDLRKTSLERISKITGPSVAKLIKNQLEGKETKPKKEVQYNLLSKKY